MHGSSPAAAATPPHCSLQGNKLFQSTFIKIINPTATLIQVLEWTLLNSAVRLGGGAGGMRCALWHRRWHA